VVIAGDGYADFCRNRYYCGAKIKGDVTVVALLDAGELDPDVAGDVAAETLEGILYCQAGYSRTPA
jgi:hypothetical protein